MMIAQTDRPFRLLPKRLGDIALWLVAAFHVMLAAILLMTLALVSPADAQEAAECGGNNVLTELKEKDPVRYQSVLDEAAAIPNGKGIFWKLEKDGQKPSWLMGTMHLTDPRVLTMPVAAQVAHDNADTIVIESDEILDDKKAAAALLSKPELTMFTDGTTINSLLSPEDAARLEAGLKSRGISLGLVSRMKPWMISGFVALPACEFARKAKGASFLDKKIAEDAIAQGHKVVGLETLVEQLVALSELPVDFHLKSLIETLELGDRMNDAVETMIQLYVAGDVGMTMPMLKVVSPDKPGEDAGSYVAFEQRIVVDRNKVMATRAAPILEKGNVFMAVGALHLSGDEGLVELFRKAGYTVTAVN